jgi:DNA-binding IclR family transcriptional regulator
MSSKETITPAHVVFGKHEHFDVEGCASVYNALADLGSATLAELAVVLELSQQTVYRRLQVMFHAGHVVSDKPEDGVYVWSTVPLNLRRAN